GEPRSAGDKLGLCAIFGPFALLFIYMGLSQLIDRGRIKADRKRVTCEVGPIWITKRVDIPAPGIKQFFGGQNSLRSQSTTIYMMDAGDMVHRLASGLPSQFAANQIC